MDAVVLALKSWQAAKLAKSGAIGVVVVAALGISAAVLVPWGN